jgi:hypothetical protein
MYEELLSDHPLHSLRYGSIDSSATQRSGFDDVMVVLFSARAAIVTSEGLVGASCSQEGPHQYRTVHNRRKTERSRRL